jgi:polyisoprenoid-binding protein YceI
MRRSAIRLLLVLGLGMAGSQARADDRYQTVELDPARSHAGFSLKALWLFQVSGHFGDMRGTVRIDHFRSQAVVDAHIDVNSAHMANRDYEAEMRSAEFFDAARYPDIHFASEAFPLVRLDRGGDLPGVLTLHGVSHPVLLIIEPSACARPAVDCALEASGTIRRSDFGMRAHRATLGDRVELALSIYIAPQPG